MKIRIKVPRGYRLKLIFLARLTVLGIIFQIVWRLNPNFSLLKLIVAYAVAFLTASQVVSDLSGIFVVKDNFSLLVVTDCTGWKELFVFFSLLISWPKEKDWKRAAISAAGIFLFNIFRLSYLVVFNQGFDYFHPAFQLFAIFVILAFWLWSINVKKKVRRKKRKKRGR